MRGHFGCGFLDRPPFGGFGHGWGRGFNPSHKPYFGAMGCSDFGGRHWPGHHGHPGCGRPPHHRDHEESPERRPRPFQEANGYTSHDTDHEGPHHRWARRGHRYDSSPDGRPQRHGEPHPGRHGPQHRPDEGLERCPRRKRRGCCYRSDCSPPRHGRFDHHGPHRRDRVHFGPRRWDNEGYPCGRPGPYGRPGRHGCDCQTEPCCSGNREHSERPRTSDDAENDRPCEIRVTEPSAGDTVLVQRIVVEKAPRPRSV